MKGETHAASLVLESYGGPSRKFDVTLGLEYITGQASKGLQNFLRPSRRKCEIYT